MIIKCPRCKAEYTLAEIFYKNDILKEYDITKSVDGKILQNLDQDDIDVESYICDYCSTPFEVSLEIKAKTKELPNFNDVVLFNIGEYK